MGAFKSIVGFKGKYKINESGKIMSSPKPHCTREKYLKNKLSASGYEEVTLFNDNTRNYFLVHRLVAQAFIPNPENKACVNHINGIRNDNRVENLEWCTSSENATHAYRKLNRVHPRGASKTIIKVSLDGFLLDVFSSKKEAAKDVGVSAGTLIRKFNGEKIKIGNFILIQ